MLPDGTTLSVSAVGSKEGMREWGADWKGEGGEGGNAKPLEYVLPDGTTLSVRDERRLMEGKGMMGDGEVIWK